MVMPNYWLLHGKNKKSKDSTVDLLAFRREVIKTYLKIICEFDIVLKDHAAECFGHVVVLAWTSDWIESTITEIMQALNANAKSAKRTLERGEKKCDCGLHNHCFEEWHGINQVIIRFSFSWSLAVFLTSFRVASFLTLLTTT